jgi:integrase
MSYNFFVTGNGRRVWRKNFTAKHADGTTSKRQAQKDVTKNPDHWQKDGKKVPRAIAAQLDAKQLQIEAKILADSPVTDGKKTIREICIEHLKEHATLVPIKGGKMLPSMRPNTISEYDHYFNRHVIPELGTVRIARLTSHQVFTFYQKVQANGASGETLKHLRKCFQAFLNWAEEKHYIEKNPTGKDSLKLVARAAQRQTEEKARINNLSTAQLVEISELIKTKYKRFAFTTHILAYHGLRLGEALAIRFEDMDLDANNLFVTHQIQRVAAPKLIDVEYETGLTDVAPKTPESDRVITLDQRTKELVEAIPFEERQGYVLATKEGTPYDSDNFARDYIYKLKDDLVEKGLMDASYKFTSHMYRKFFATLLAHKGVDDMTIKNAMGHKEIGTTQQSYFVNIEDMNRIDFNVSDDLVKEV